MSKKYDTSRPSPPYSATLFDDGYIAYGNNGNKWIIKSTSKGVKRWTKFEKTDHESHNTPKKKSKRKSPKKSSNLSSRKTKTSSEILKKLSSKYNLQTYGSGRPISPKRLAERLNLYAGSKLTKT